MKGWFMSGKKQCPLFIEPDQWARLCDYWGKPETTQKTQVMVKARQQVKNTSNVGRVGKAGKKALLVRISYFDFFAMFSDCSLILYLLLNVISNNPNPFEVSQSCCVCRHSSTFAKGCDIVK